MSDIEESKQAVKDFIQELEKSNLIKFPNNELLPLYLEAKHRSEISNLSESAYQKIYGHHKKEKNTFIPENEWTAFNKKLNLNEMREISEEWKLYLKSILDPQKIDSTVNELGTYLNSIYNKLGYVDEKKKKMNEVFFKDFRNALSHLDYDISLDSITWRDNRGNKTTWSNDYLLTVMTQMTNTRQIVSEKVKELMTKM